MSNWSFPFTTETPLFLATKLLPLFIEHFLTHLYMPLIRVRIELATANGTWFELELIGLALILISFVIILFMLLLIMLLILMIVLPLLLLLWGYSFVVRVKWGNNLFWIGFYCWGLLVWLLWLYSLILL